MILTINRDILFKMMNSGSEYKLVDVMDTSCYNEEHIKGAISIPIEYIEKRAEFNLKKTGMVILYSKNIYCNKSMIAAEKLESMGYDKIYVYKEGIEDYKKNFLPLEVIFLPDFSINNYA